MRRFVIMGSLILGVAFGAPSVYAGPFATLASNYRSDMLELCSGTKDPAMCRSSFSRLASLADTVDARHGERDMLALAGDKVGLERKQAELVDALAALKQAQAEAIVVYAGIVAQQRPTTGGK